MNFFEQVFTFLCFCIIFHCLPWLQKINFQQGKKFLTKVSTAEKNAKTRNTLGKCVTFTKLLGSMDTLKREKLTLLGLLYTCEISQIFRFWHQFFQVFRVFSTKVSNKKMTRKHENPKNQKMCSV